MLLNMILNDNDQRPLAVEHTATASPCGNLALLEGNQSNNNNDNLVESNTNHQQETATIVVVCSNNIASADQFDHHSASINLPLDSLATNSIEIQSKAITSSVEDEALDSLPYLRNKSTSAISKISPTSTSTSSSSTSLSPSTNSPNGNSVQCRDDSSNNNSTPLDIGLNGFGDVGNKCGKCQNHEIEISKKGHARDCPFKKCNCLKCRLLDARSDILQVISGKETKLKGTKKDPNCGFCQNHGVKILRKGHVRSCGFGQERHFKLDNCFDCEVHYIRNEVNRLQIKMRRAMKEDRALSEEQRKTAREPITRDEVEKVCDMARLARKKREKILTQQAGESTSQLHHHHHHHHNNHHHNHNHQTAIQVVNPTNLHSAHNTPSGSVWRPWSQHQVAAAMAAQQQQQQQLISPNNTSKNHHHHYHQHQLPPMAPPPQHQPTQSTRHLVVPPMDGGPGNHQVAVGITTHQPISGSSSSNNGINSNSSNTADQQQLFNTLFRLIVAQFVGAQTEPTNQLGGSNGG